MRFFLLQLEHPILTSFRHSKCIPDIDTTNLLSLKYKMRSHLTYQAYFCAFREFIKVPFNRIISTLSAIDWNICCITLKKNRNTRWKRAQHQSQLCVFFLFVGKRRSNDFVQQWRSLITFGWTTQSLSPQENFIWCNEFILNCNSLYRYKKMLDCEASA